jgi:peptide deformylase
MSPVKKTNISDPAILSEGHEVLRLTAKEVPVDEIGSSHIKQVILDMKNALKSQSDGIGLAAPQIGISLRIFIVSKRIFNSNEPGIPLEDLVFINPEIVKESKEKVWMEGEGCLSVRWYYGKVKRATRVTLRAYNEAGQLIERGAGGLLAHIFQHEVDHLNGILFIDKAKDVEKVEPETPKEKKPTKKKTV